MGRQGRQEGGREEMKVEGKVKQNREKEEKGVNRRGKKKKKKETVITQKK